MHPSTTACRAWCCSSASSRRGSPHRCRSARKWLAICRAERAGKAFRSTCFLHDRQHVALQVLEMRKGSTPGLLFGAPVEFDALGHQAIVLLLDVVDHECHAHKSADHFRSLLDIVRRTLLNRKAHILP